MTPMPHSVRCAALLSLLVTFGSLPACLLPSFEKVDDADASTGESPTPPPSRPGKACGLSAELPLDCDTCIRAHCCEEAKGCDEGTDCGKDLTSLPLSPVSDTSEDFEPMLACLQKECDTECDISWGCVGEYEWPTPGENDYAFTVRDIDFAAEPVEPLPSVEVKACQAVDPSCTTGLVDTDTTDDNGLALLSVPPRFDGYFLFSGNSSYLPTTARWSEPLHRVSGFTHYALSRPAVNALGLITGELGSGEKFPDDAGFLIFRAQNCLPIKYIAAPGYPTGDAAGVVIELEPDGGSRVYYTDESFVPVRSLMATTVGLGGAFELPTQVITVQGYRADTMAPIMNGRVRVDPGAIGFMYLLPRSR